MFLISDSEFQAPPRAATMALITMASSFAMILQAKYGK
jgi:hypothetical protein